MRNRSLISLVMVLLLSVASANGVRAEAEEVTIPLVENMNGDVGIPVEVKGNFATITLVNPDGKKLKVVMDDTDARRVKIIVTEPNGQKEKSFLILQDWPQDGTVIPFSQDWPQDAVVSFTIKGQKGKTTMNLVVQDWPQDSIEVTLT